MEAAATDEQPVIDWFADRQDVIKAQAPTTAEVDAWLAKMAAQFSWTAAPRSTALEHLEATLTSTITAIRQESDRRTRRKGVRRLFPNQKTAEQALVA